MVPKNLQRRPRLTCRPSRRRRPITRACPGASADHHAAAARDHHAAKYRADPDGRDRRRRDDAGADAAFADHRRQNRRRGGDVETPGSRSSALHMRNADGTPTQSKELFGAAIGSDPQEDRRDRPDLDRRLPSGWASTSTRSRSSASRRNGDTQLRHPEFRRRGLHELAPPHPRSRQAHPRERRRHRARVLRNRSHRRGARPLRRGLIPEPLHFQFVVGVAGASARARGRRFHGLQIPPGATWGIRSSD